MQASRRLHIRVWLPCAATYRSHIIAGQQCWRARLAGDGHKCKRRGPGCTALHMCVCSCSSCLGREGAKGRQSPLSASHRRKPWRAGCWLQELSEPAVAWRESAALSRPLLQTSLARPGTLLPAAVCNTSLLLLPLLLRHTHPVRSFPSPPVSLDSSLPLPPFRRTVGCARERPATTP